MSRKKKIVLYLTGSFICLLMVLAISGFLVVQTRWFRDQVRTQLVGIVERASGGRTEIASFDFDWRRLTAEVKGFVLHGTEPAGSPPLFQAETIKIGLKIVSILKKDIDLALLEVQRPQVYVLVKPDGTTNVPSPKVKAASDKSTVEQILALAIRHFELKNGKVQYDSKTIPLDVRGDDLAAVMNYELFAERYIGKISFRELRLQGPKISPPVGFLETELAIGKNQLHLPSLKIGLQRSVLNLEVNLVDFKNPRLDATVKGTVFGDELGKLLKISFLRRGEFAMQGSGHYEPNAYTFSGTVAGRGVHLHSTTFDLQKAAINTSFHLSQDRLALRKISISALGAKIIGEADIRQWKDFRFAGNMNGLSVQQATGLFVERPIEWNGMASGPVEVTGKFGADGVRGLIAKSALAITPGFQGIPLQGNLNGVYDQQRSVIELGQSNIQLPHTQLAVSGTLGSLLNVTLDSTNLDDVMPALRFGSSNGEASELPIRLANGSAHFKGTLSGPWSKLEIAGDLSANQLIYENILVEELKTTFAVNEDGLYWKGLSARHGDLHIAGAGELALSKWKADGSSLAKGRFDVRSADLAKLKDQFGDKELPISGVASGTVLLDGTLGSPAGTAQLVVNRPELYGEKFERISLNAALKGNRLEVTNGRFQLAQSLIRFNGAYDHSDSSWRTGTASISLNTDRFPVHQLQLVRKNQPNLSAQLNLQAASVVKIQPNRIDLQALNGQVALLDIVNQNEVYGNISLEAKTSNRKLQATINGDFRGSAIRGQGAWLLQGDYPGQGEVTLSQLNIGRIYALFRTKQTNEVPFDGVIQGDAKFSGPLRKPEQWKASVKLNRIELSPLLNRTQRASQLGESFVLKNSGPLVIEAANQVVTLHPTKFEARNTEFNLNGVARLSSNPSVDAKLSGTINLRLLRLFDSEIKSTGSSVVKVSVAGPLKNPSVNGTIELKEATFHYADFPNGLDHANGVIRFDKNRATIQKLTAQSGGGELSADGFISLTNGLFFYKLEANTTNVRVRIPQGLSVNMDSALKFTGTSESSLLSGNVTVMRASFNPSTDIGSMLAASARPVATPSAPNEFLRGVQFNIHVQSAPVLQVNTTLTQDVQGEIDLRVRGTPDRPVVLGRVSISEGQLQVFGNKYTVNRADVNFFNPTKIEPVLDIDLQTVTRAITVNISVTGPMNQLNISYRSDPPLQPNEIIALLAVGRSPNTTSGLANSQVTSSSNFLASGANTVLGQAIASPVSNRLQRFFGVSQIKIDPQLRGTESIPQARLTVEQQISKEITLTYTTNLSRTSQQVVRVEWAFTKQFSVIAIRDENGTVGVDFQYRKQFK